MDTTTLFDDEKTEHAIAEFPFQNYREPLYWEGVAYRIEMTDEVDSSLHASIDVAVMTRAKDSLLEHNYLSPIVIRQAWEDKAEDFVFYGTLTDNSFIGVYQHERVIDDVWHYLYGDWPIWTSRVLPTGFGHVLGMLEAVTGGEFTAVS